ncbi:MAG: hypothetical protein IPG02_15960 [Ignavibacteria bacterium]|nr:hypothetical protein [Ignavibacteria bacterium]
MKVKFTAFLLGILLFSHFNDSFSQGLNSVTSPDGVNVVAVGNLGKIYRSADAAATWGVYTLSSDNLNFVSSYGNNVWIAGSAGNIYRTTKTLSHISTSVTGQTFKINCVTFVDNNTGYLCGDGGRLYKSVDGGASWTSSASGIGAADLNGMSFSDALSGVVVGDNGSVYTTIDGGKNWNQETVPTTRNLLKTKKFPEGIIAVGEYGTILTKENLGSWQSVVTRTDNDIRGVSGTSMNSARVCGGGGFIRNNSNGRSNFFNFEINPMLANLVDIFQYDSNKGFAVSSLNYAVIRTTNGGTNWILPASATVAYNWGLKTPSSSGIGNNLCMHPTERNTAYVVYGNKVYVSRDRGDSWTQISTISIGTRAHSFYVTPLDTNVWLAAIESTPDKVVRSTDYGATWSTILSYNFSSYGQPLEMDQNIPGTFYYAPDGTTTGFFKSTDNGASFTSVSNSNPFTSPCDIIAMWDSSQVLYVGDDGADIFKSTNNGVNWTMVKPGSSSEVPSMCNTVFDKSLCYATTWSSSQVFRTVNYGTNWNSVSTNSGSGWGSDMCHEDPTVILTGNYGAQAYLSTNGGANFFNVNTGLSGAGAGIMVPERGWMLNMQTGSLFKLNIVYSVPTTSLNAYTVSVKVAPEGMLDQNSNTLYRTDSVSVLIRKATSPFELVDSSVTRIDEATLTGSNLNILPAGSYYIVIRHRNGIETWSKSGGEALGSGNVLYNFTSAQSQAYGNNMTLKGTSYCIYSGNVNQDDIIDGLDLSLVDNDAYNFSSGYFVTDLNGDDIVDASDLALCDMNASNFVAVVRP